MKAKKNSAIEERKRAVAEEKATREREKQAALAEHQREKALAGAKQSAAEEELHAQKRLREQHRATFEAACTRLNPDAALEDRFRKKYPEIQEKHLTAWARAQEQRESSVEMERMMWRNNLSDVFRERVELLRELSAVPVKPTARLKQTLTELERSRAAGRSRSRYPGKAVSPVPDDAARASALGWKTAAETILAAYPDRSGHYLAELAVHVWAAPKAGHFNDGWTFSFRRREECMLCGLPFPAHAPLISLLCETCATAGLAAFDAGKTGADRERVRADLVRAVRELVSEDEAGGLVARIEKWLASPLPAGEMQPSTYCRLCLPQDRKAEDPLLVVRMPPQLWDENYSEVFCRSCLTRAKERQRQGST